jgi:NAD(P)H dehydrogenase (quinone)
MKYVISGASAAMGKMVADQLLEKIPVTDLTLISRNPAALQSWADRGVRVLAGHHGDADSLKAGYEGADVLFMISSLAVGQRIEHHRKTIDVAKAAGIKHITYTSVAGTHPVNPTPSATEHIATERMLWESGISFTALRNQMYAEIFFTMINDQALPTGRWIHNSKSGGFSPVARTDIAACVTAIMLNPERHDRVVYEITGSERYTFPEVAALASKLWNTPIEYVAVSDDEMYSIFEQLGVPKDGDPSQTFMPLIFGADELVQQFHAYEMGLLDITSAHVEFITGQKPRLLESVLQEMIAENA